MAYDNKNKNYGEFVRYSNPGVKGDYQKKKTYNTKIGQTDWIESFSKLGAKTNLVLALVVLLCPYLLNHVAHIPEFLQNLLQIASWIGVSVFCCLAFFAYKDRKWLGDRWSSINSVANLKYMNWYEFEQVVGEQLRRDGFDVKHKGGNHADGGIDLIATKAKEKIIVQCKHWKKNNVGVPIVREMFGVLHHEKVDRVFIVTCGYFSRDAWEFAKGKPIELIDGKRFLSWKFRVQKNSGTQR